MSQHEQCLAFCSLQFFSFLPSFFSLTAGDLRRIPGAPQSRAGSSLCSSPPRQPDRLPALLPGTERSSGFPVVLGWPQRASWQWQSNGHSQSDYSGEIQTVLFWVTTLPPAGGLSSLHSLPWVKAQHSALSF